MVFEVGSSLGWSFLMKTVIFDVLEVFFGGHGGCHFRVF
jgi:hypothetical protein